MGELWVEAGARLTLPCSWTIKQHCSIQCKEAQWV